MMIKLSICAETVEEFSAKITELSAMFSPNTAYIKTPAEPVPVVPAPVPAPIPVASTPAPAPAPVPVAPAPAPAPVVPTAPAPTYDLETLARACGQLVDAKRDAEVKGLLAQYGISALTDLRPEYYGAFAAALRQMGAVI